MALQDIDRFPPEPQIDGAISLVRNGLMQTDMDADHHKILNLDTSNLILDELPSQAAPAHKWFRAYDQGTHTFGSTQPAFIDINGGLTLQQQEGITRLSTVTTGVWRATPIDGHFLPTLNHIAAPTGLVTMDNHRITDLADPVEEQDAVNLRLINNIASGLHPKPAVRCATTANIVLSDTIHPVDGVTLVGGVDRVLVKNQSSGRHWQNGIWLAQTGGAWTRVADIDVKAEFETATCFVLEGDTHANETWLQVTPNTTSPNFFITQDSPDPAHTYPEFQLLSRSNIDNIVTGDGLDRTGNTIFAIGTANRISVGVGIDIASTYVGQASIDTVGTIDTGTWEADIIASEFGGTGVDNGGFNITIGGDFTVQVVGAAIPESYLIFDITGATELVLPQLGTLATLNGNEIFTNKHISGAQIDSGVVLISHGGTSANTAQAALKNLLPDTTGHAGDVLHTDGEDLFYWGPVTPTP